MNIKKKSLKKFKIRSDPKSLASSLIEVKKVCDNYGLFFWLNYGALLGMVRDKELLYWNNDIEVCCWADKLIDQKIISITDTLVSNGYRCFYYKSDGTLNIKDGDSIDININIFWEYNGYAIRPHEPRTEFNIHKSIIASSAYWIARSIYTYSGKFNKKLIFNKFLNKKKISLSRQVKDFIKRIFILFFFYFPSGVKKSCFERLVSMSEHFGEKFQLTAFPIHYFKTFKKIKFYGSFMNIPKKSDDLLSYIYGYDWKIPKDNWSFYDEKNKSHSKMIYIDKKKFHHNYIDFK